MENFFIILGFIVVYILYRIKVGGGGTKKEPSRNRKKRTITVLMTKEDLTLTLDQEVLSKKNKAYVVEGQSELEYTVKLNRLTCTCKDFTFRRQDYPKNDIRRVCKHISRVIIAQRINTKVSKNPLINFLIRSSAADGKGVMRYGPAHEIKIKAEGHHEPFYLFLPDNDYAWCNIYVKHGKSFRRHGYHLIEKRWSYGENPFPTGYHCQYNGIINYLSDNRSDPIEWKA